MFLYKHFKGVPSQLATRETWPPLPGSPNTHYSRGRPGEGRCQHRDGGGSLALPPTETKASVDILHTPPAILRAAAQAGEP